MRPIFNWKLRSRSLKLGERTLIMGIVNVTRDSFSDGGQFFDRDRAIAHAIELLSDGAEIVNDVSGFTWDGDMLPSLSASTGGCVLMHTRGRPEEWRNLPPLDPAEVVPLVFEDLRRLAERAVHAGVQRERIVLDPGFGFGKRLDENFSLLAGLAELHQLKFPLLSGTSRKSFLAKETTADRGADRLAGTIATVTASILQGAHLVRVHDVKSTIEAVRAADSILHARELAQSGRRGSNSQVISPLVTSS